MSYIYLQYMSSGQEERKARHDHRKPINRYILSSSNVLKGNDAMRRHVLRRLIFLKRGQPDDRGDADSIVPSIHDESKRGALALIDEADQSKTAQPQVARIARLIPRARRRYQNP
jgi:hypothetical protein